MGFTVSNSCEKTHKIVSLLGDGDDDKCGWERPPSDTDKLFMSIGGGDLIEVGHPAPSDGGDDIR